jgi:hypothetical protein
MPMKKIGWTIHPPVLRLKMKVNPRGYGMLEIIAENDAERVWLGILLTSIERSHRPFLSHYFRVDLEEMCRKDDMTPAKNMAIEDVIDAKDDHTWGLVDKIHFCPTGEYVPEELQRRISVLAREGKKHT